MTVTEIKKIAKEMGISVGKMKKQELVQTIQKSEGNIPCFMTDSSNDCSEMECLWRNDCIK